MTKWVGILFIAIILLGVPFVFSNPYYLKIIIEFGIFAIFAASLNVIVGYVGEISFGHAAFFGLGAYFSTLLVHDLGLSFWLSLIVSLILTGLIGMVIGLLSLRLQGVHFAIITLAFAEIFRLITLNLSGITRGAMGLSVTRPNFPFTKISLSDDTFYYYFVFLMLIVVLLFIKYMLNTPFGKGIIAIREGDLLASSIGINVAKYKIAVFTISSMIAGLAGVLYAPFVGIITPDLMSVHYTATGLLMVIVGGKGFLLGPLFGAFIFTVIPEFLMLSPEAKLLVFGVILLLSVLFVPKGLAYIFQGLSNKLRFNFKKNTVNEVNQPKKEVQ